jgi:hypothetical protein
MPQPGIGNYFRSFFFRLSISFSESRQIIPDGTPLPVPTRHCPCRNNRTRAGAIIANRSVICLQHHHQVPGDVLRTGLDASAR